MNTESPDRESGQRGKEQSARSVHTGSRSGFFCSTPLAGIQTWATMGVGFLSEVGSSLRGEVRPVSLPWPSGVPSSDICTESPKGEQNLNVAGPLTWTPTIQRGRYCDMGFAAQTSSRKKGCEPRQGIAVSLRHSGPRPPYGTHAVRQHRKRGFTSIYASC